MPFDQVGQPGPPRGTGQRAINLPPVLIWLIGINVVIQVVRELLGETFDNEIIQQFGLIPAAYTSAPGGDMFSLLVAPITYQFLHGGWMHLGINMISLAAFGVPVVRVLGPNRFILFYLSAGIFAGFVHVFFFPDSGDPVVGASGAISGVFGAVLMLMRYVGSISSLLPIAGIWIALNIFFGVVGGTPGAGGDPVAWTAHIGGFVYGLAAIRLFMPRQGP
jgi:membrane associated rhomboid family serine protease